jgi:mRNA interferase HigB
MNVISRPAIRQAIERHPDATTWLEKWWENAKREHWSSLHHVRAVYPATDQVDCCLVFNACGNKFRLIVRVSYANEWSGGTLFVKHFLTHAEYSKDDWKKDCM